MFMTMRAAAIIAVLSVLCACGGQALRDSDLLEGYGVMRLTEELVRGDAEKALAVRTVAATIKRYGTDEEFDTVDLFVAGVRAQIPWDRLGPTDTWFAEQILELWQQGLTEQYGPDLLPEHLRLSVAKVADWVILAARP